MKNLSDYQDDEALDLLAELIEPVANVFGDKEIAQNFRKNNMAQVVKLACKNYKKDLVHIMATLEGVEDKDFHYNVVTFPKLVLQVLNDPIFKDFFSSQGMKATETPSGSATENIEEKENTSSNM